MQPAVLLLDEFQSRHSTAARARRQVSRCVRDAKKDREKEKKRRAQLAADRT